MNTQSLDRIRADRDDARNAALALAESDDFNPDPADWRDATPLRAVAAARHGVEDARAALDRAVVDAYAAGFSWGSIGMMLDVSRQAARQRFGHLVA